MSVKFNDNSRDVLDRMKRNKAAALDAVGIKAVGLIVRNMERGYGKPIRQTGDLMRDVSSEVADENTVKVGNTLKYSLFVHEGTRKMRGRAYIRDALLNGFAALKKVAENELNKGF